MRFLSLDIGEGKVCVVNARHIVGIMPDEYREPDGVYKPGCKVYMDHDLRILARHTIEEVIDMLREAYE